MPDHSLIKSSGSSSNIPPPLELSPQNLANRALAARGKSQPAPRADLFRQLCVPESAKYSSMPVVRRLDLTKNLSLSAADDFHHGLLGFFLFLVDFAFRRTCFYVGFDFHRLSPKATLPLRRFRLRWVLL